MLVDYLTKSRRYSHGIYFAPRITCADGFSMSVQAGDHAYCTPRSNFGPWDEFEVGFPSESVPELMSFAENPDDPTGTVYACVPTEIIERVIAVHGGMDNGTAA